MLYDDLLHPQSRPACATAGERTPHPAGGYLWPSLFVRQFGVLNRDNEGVATLLNSFEIRDRHVTYSEITTGRATLDPTMLISGSVQFMHAVFEHLAINIPAPLGFPTELAPWLHRHVDTMTAAEALTLAAGQRLFIKPAGEVKAFTGGLTNQIELIDTVRSLDPDTAVFVSEPVQFLAEWRCFVVEGRMRACVQYLPDIDECRWPTPDPAALTPLIDAAWSSCRRAGMSVDVGMLPDGRLALVEMNDGYALGGYSIDPGDYFELLWARWRQLVNTHPST
jgi:hypothetical protein